MSQLAVDVHRDYITVDEGAWLDMVAERDSELELALEQWASQAYEAGTLGYLDYRVMSSGTITRGLVELYGQDQVHGYDGGDPWLLPTSTGIPDEHSRYLWVFVNGREYLVKFANEHGHSVPLQCWRVRPEVGEAAVVEFDRATGVCLNGHRLEYRAGAVDELMVNGLYLVDRRLHEFIQAHICDRCMEPCDREGFHWIACPICRQYVELFMTA